MVSDKTAISLKAHSMVAYAEYIVILNINATFCSFLFSRNFTIVGSLPFRTVLEALPIEQT